jgi:hypothetical protein
LSFGFCPVDDSAASCVIRNLARLMATYSTTGAERTLAMQLDRQHEAMLRKGIPPEIVARELRALESAVRAWLWTIVMQGGDAA